jgi:hypothetical protein
LHFEDVRGVSILVVAVFTLGLGNPYILIAIPTPVPITITSINPSSATPLSLITITGTGFDPALEVSVVFFTSTQRQKIKAVQVDTTSVQVSAPLLLPGKLNVQVVENPASGPAVRSNVLKKALVVGGLSVSTAPEGEVTLSFLEGQLSQLQQLQTAIAGTPFDTSDVEATIANQIANLEPFIARIDDVMSRKMTRFALGTIHGTPVYTNLASLKRSDRLILAILNAQATGSQLLPLSSSSAAGFPSGDQSMAQRAADYVRVFTSDSSETDRSIAAQAYFSIDSISIASLQNTINVMTGAILAFAAADVVLAGAPILATAIFAGEIIGEISAVDQVGTSLMAVFGLPGSEQALCEQIYTLSGDEIEEKVISFLAGRVWSAPQAIIDLVSAAKDLVVEPEKKCPTPTPTPTPAPMPTPNFVGTFTGTYQYVPGFGSGPAVPFTITIFGTSSSLSDDWQAGPYPNGYSGGGEGSGTPTGSDVILLDEDGETELNLTLSVDNNTLTGVEENPCPPGCTPAISMAGGPGTPCYPCGLPQADIESTRTNN